MSEIKCEVIRDLLPLYEDNAASQETQELVRKHLADCPGCREELRKMRVPVSLPPDEDEEAVKRFLAHRAEVRKKRNRKIICAASALAVLAVLLLCYIRPRSWEDISSSKSEEATSLSANFLVYYFRSEGLEIDHGWDTWSLTAEQAEGAATEAILQVLQSSAYRKSLKNLIPRDVWVLEGAKDRIHMGIVWNGTHWESLTICDNGVMLLGDTLYYMDEGMCGRLGNIIQEYGEFQEKAN